MVYVHFFLQSNLEKKSFPECFFSFCNAVYTYSVYGMCIVNVYRLVFCYTFGVSSRVPTCQETWDIAQP